MLWERVRSFWARRPRLQWSDPRAWASPRENVFVSGLWLALPAERGPLGVDLGVRDEAALNSLITCV
jgi:hypothetical protein